MLNYSTTTAVNSLRTIHTITINDESLTTTRAKEVLTFAKPRIASKYEWKYLKEAVRKGEALTIN